MVLVYMNEKSSIVDVYIHIYVAMFLVQMQVQMHLHGAMVEESEINQNKPELRLE